MFRSALAAACGVAVLCAAASAEITILKEDGSVTSPLDAEVTFSPLTGGWTITLKRLYNPGGFTSYEIQGNGGEIIDDIFVDVPCWSPFGECVTAGSPTVVRVVSMDPGGIRTLKNLEHRTEGEFLLNLVDVREDLGSVEAGAIGAIRVGRDIIGDIVATTPDNPGRGIGTVVVQRDILGDIRTEGGRINTIWVPNGSIGTAAAPVEIRARYRINRIITYLDVFADITARAGGGTGGLSGFYAYRFHGRIEFQEFIDDIESGIPGRFLVLNEFVGDIVLGGAHDQEEVSFALPRTGFDGRVIINADNDPSNTWNVPIVLGADFDPDPLPIFPGYALTSAQLGGGSIGLAPFELHEEGCVPLPGTTLAQPQTIELRHYGPVAVSGPQPVSALRRAIGTLGPWLPAPSPKFAVDPENANILQVFGLETGYAYELTPTADLVCAISAGPPVVWAGSYAVTIDAPDDCPADVDGSGTVDFIDLLNVLQQWGTSGGPSDIDGDGEVAFNDVVLLLFGWGEC